ncbi:MAG: cytochrome c [Ignavibacteriaceae bacterium]|jgi:cytochrome c553|nr:cytochrome c [Ignavibacteriaceae bacterium]
MTKTQIWSAAFLGIFVILFFLQKFAGTEYGSSPSMGMGAAMPQKQSTETMASSDASGEVLVKQFNCTTCHGVDLQGTNMAPALVGLKSYYDRDKLINYLRNPNAYLEQDRFKEYKDKFKNIVMPAYGNKDVKELGKITDYLLGLN